MKAVLTSTPQLIDFLEIEGVSFRIPDFTPADKPSVVVVEYFSDQDLFDLGKLYQKFLQNRMA